MISALWTGIAGLKASQTAIDNEANNITNANTIGYKASRVNFADMIYQDSIGKGVRVTSAEKMFTQGTTRDTGNNYDVALNGDGFLAVVKENPNGTSETYYTRAGNLRKASDGTLIDANGYKVQGWAMSSVDPTSDVTSTNSNWTYFNDNFTKIAANQIVERNSNIETYAAKMTDYTSTAATDASDLTGSGIAKTKSSKQSDIEQLVRKYQEALSAYAKDPSAASSSSVAQISQITFPTTDLDGVGQSVNVTINGDTYSVEYQNITATTDMIAKMTDDFGTIPDINGDSSVDSADYNIIASRMATYQALADKISNITGLNAQLVNSSGDPTSDYNDVLGAAGTTGAIIQIESIDPGEDFLLGDVTEIKNGSTSKGSSTTSTNAVEGTGKGAVDSARDALSNAVSGKQYDVYTMDDLFNDASGSRLTWDATDTLTYTYNGNTYTTTYSATINSYDAAIDDLASQIDTGESTLSARNINGNLVITSNTYGEDFTSGVLQFNDNAGATPAGTLTQEKNLEKSGNTGANAEFMQIVSNVDQTASRTSIQLDLNTLGLTDSAKATFSVDESGIITMSQDGVDFVVGQMAIAQFGNNIELNAVGQNLLEETTNSGTPTYELDNDNGTTFLKESLELSNSELSDSLVNLMIYQRAFEANSKSVTTADEILNTLIDLKR